MVGENPIEIPGADCSCPVLNQVADRGFICGLVVCCTHLDLLLIPDICSRALQQASSPVCESAAYGFCLIPAHSAAHFESGLLEPPLSRAAVKRHERLFAFAT